jgi:hypothetical protein
MLLPGVCFFVGSPEFSSSRYITGTLVISNPWAVRIIVYFQ